MTIYEFNDYDEMEQIETFWNGALIGKEKMTIVIFSVDRINNFYVEYK